MSDNQAIRNQTAKATLNDYEYLANFKVGYFENLNNLDRLIEGVNFCMKQTFTDNKLNEQRFFKCYNLRNGMMERADRLNLFD
jgi:hypothetical protein